MQKTTVMGLALAACFSLNCFAGPAAEACVKDLDALPSFLLENDAGARDRLAQLGQKYFDDALAEAKSAASQIRGNASCAPVIQKYLRAWRRGHLSVEEITAAPASTAPQQSSEDAAAEHLKKAPTIEILSAKTLRLTLKSFELYNRDPLIALLKAHREDLEGHPNWIIDVRGNGGGGDDSFRPLRPWLMPDEFASANTEILATPANIEGYSRVCAIFAPGDAECQKFVTDSIARMRKAAPGTYVAMDDGGAMSYHRMEWLEPHRPSRVAILIDGGCASSCEEFVLEARQSFDVKLVGQHTSGSLDYSNLAPHDLPSGRRRLWYATTRSSRIPGLTVDVAGVPPDIYLPIEGGADAKSEEARRVQNWLEGGSLAPRKLK
jgi:peptidase S41-like protein